MMLERTARSAADQAEMGGVLISIMPPWTKPLCRPNLPNQPIGRPDARSQALTVPPQTPF